MARSKHDSVDLFLANSLFKSPGGPNPQMIHSSNQAVPIEQTLVVLVLAFSFWLPTFTISPGLAQVSTVITPTEGVGDLHTRVLPNGSRIQIVGGTNNGTNLFHSFDQFNLGPGDTAQFLNTTPSLPRTENILSRVTGGNPSSIFGAIDTTSYPGANLFFLNPAGIVFGPNATLRVDGSVAFTTADYLRLAHADGSSAGIFRADPRATPQLSSAPVAAFGFLGDNPAAIALQASTLTVEPGRSISLVGGNQTFASPHPVSGTSITVPNGVTVTNGHLMASDGQINIASVASPGEITASTLEYVPNVSGQSFERLGTIQVSESAIENSGEGGGKILIRGGRLIIDGASTILSNTGDIVLDATSIQINEAGLIETRTATARDSGHIILRASGNVDMDSARITSASETSSGSAGNITFSSTQGNVSFTNFAVVTSQTQNNSKGNTGKVEIDAPHGDVLLAGPSFVFNLAQGTGRLGSIQIKASNLHMKDGSLVQGDNFTKQVGANIEIVLDSRLNLTGGSSINTSALGQADSADLIIRAKDILISENSSLFTGPSRGSTGTGGAIDLSARSLTIQNGGTISAETFGTTASATGGSITIKATDQVTLTNGASITASSTGPADAGSIFINAGQQLEVLDKSSITTQAARASGGNIDIRAIDRIRFVDSTVSTSVLAEDGKGGNIFIDPNVVILEGSEVTAKAVGGAGGNITFVTPLFLADSVSLGLLSAKSESGLNGTVLIQSPTSNLSGTVGQLVSKTSPPQVLLQNRCIALAGGEQSTFFLAGRDALPSEPGGWLSSPVAMEHWTGEEKEHASGLMVRSRGLNTQPPLVMSKDETTVLSLRRLTPPGFLVRTFAAESTGCPS